MRTCGHPCWSLLLLDQLDFDDFGPGNDPVPLAGERLATPVGLEGLDRVRGGEIEKLDLQGQPAGPDSGENPSPWCPL